MQHLRTSTLSLVASISLIATGTASPPSVFAQTPTVTPTPTPRPDSLAAYASLHRISSEHSTVITNQTMRQMAEGVVLTTAAPRNDDPALEEVTEEPATADPKARSRWRKAYSKQKRVIRTIEAEKDALRVELAEVNRRPINASSTARAAAIKEELQQLDRKLRDERSDLGRIVREARNEGAVPGWFRGL